MKGSPPELVYFPSWIAGRPGYARRIREAFRQHLESHGLRLTRQRERILGCLLSTDRHLSLEDIYTAVRRDGIGRATVFRTLKMLESSRLVDHVATSRGSSRFEVQLERPHHDHLICVECGSIQEIRWPELERIQERACRRLGFKAAWHRHEIFGRCRECASRRPPQAAAG